MSAGASPSGRYLGLDLGLRRIGVALSDSLGLTAGPLTVIERSSSAQAAEAIERLVKAHDVETIVIGLPLTLRGSRGSQAQRVESFAALLRARVAVPIVLIDERLTTVQGERSLLEAGVSRDVRKKAIDQVAAQIILQHYLDTQREAARRKAAQEDSDAPSE